MAANKRMGLLSLRLYGMDDHIEGMTVLSATLTVWENL